MVGISILLALLTLFGQGPWFLRLPLEYHRIDPYLLRPQSKVLKPTIYLYCFLIGLIYSIFTMGRVLRSHGPKPSIFYPLDSDCFYGS
ncbi:MAG: hypothetical protein ACUVQ9_06570 [Thermodesulfobacteriota bacterium]